MSKRSKILSIEIHLTEAGSVETKRDVRFIHTKEVKKRAVNSLVTVICRIADDFDMLNPLFELCESLRQKHIQQAATQGECPACGRTLDLKDGLIPYHDHTPPLRAVCPGSKQPAKARSA